MTNAPTDRGLRLIIRNLVWGNWTTGGERAVLLGPRGEVRDVCYPGGNGGSLLTKRKQLLDINELRAVVYLGALSNEFIQVTLVEIYEPSGDRTTHAYFAEAEDLGGWLSTSAERLDNWIQQRWAQGKED